MQLPPLEDDDPDKPPTVYSQPVIAWAFLPSVRGQGYEREIYFLPPTALTVDGSHDGGGQFIVDPAGRVIHQHVVEWNSVDDLLKDHQAADGSRLQNEHWLAPSARTSCRKKTG